MKSSTSKAANKLCGVCQHCCAIYTCPRCAIRTCSLPCSKSHKLLQPCSGERDKTAYVPMNEYGWGTMANDYTYLEEVGRKAAEWGVDIVKGGFLTGAVLASRGRGHGRGRGRGRNKVGRTAPRGSGKGKRDVLRMQLDARDIYMEILPAGMHKRRVNQSTWDAKSKSPLLSVEFVFHRAKDPLAPSDSPEPLPFTLITHRNSLDAKISDIVRQHIHDRSSKDNISSWLKSLFSSPESEDTELVYLMCQHSDSPLNPASKAYYKLDSMKSLMTGLCNRAFVEYPTIDIWEQGGFTGTLVETDGTFVGRDEELRPVKRRRLDAAGGNKLIKNLLGGYTSNEDPDEENNVTNLLGGYGSDEEALETASIEESQHSEEADSVTMEEPTLEDVCDLLESVGPDSFTKDQIAWKDEAEEEEVDWGDNTDDEAELWQALPRSNASHQPT